MPATRYIPVVLAIAAAAGLAPAAGAGGGPETTVVVVNADSPTSWRVANEYVRLRKIPATHVCAIEGVGTLQIVPIETFRTRLWAPVKAFLDKSGFGDEIDVIAWSADFPYGVDYESERPESMPLKMEDGRNSMWWPIASLTGMTYLARFVEAKDAVGYLWPGANRYYRRGSADSMPERPLSKAEQATWIEAQTAIDAKKWDVAAAAYDRILTTFADHSASLYNLACCRAHLGRLDDAMKALAASVTAGYDRVDAMEADADLEPLRAREDYRALVERLRKAAAGEAATLGFRGRWAWTPTGTPVPDAPPTSRDRYFLSTMLAYTGEWGNSAPEALASLTASAGSDGTDPAGTFYFLLKPDEVRTTTRAGRFDAAIEALRSMDRKAETLSAGEKGQDGVLPVSCSDVIGATIGSAGFQWAACKSRIVPGAIVENLTSFGAVFNNAGQTKLTELIRAGAAGSSGTVNEPYALQWKFPDPSIHVHYAAGCSLSEAFYQSVWGPYQLLIVGDPLARPFAHFADLTPMPIAGPLAGTTVVDPHLEAAAGHPIADVELWIDGVLIAHAKPREPFHWDTTTVEDGQHELRVVAVEDSAIATRTSAPTTVTVANGKATATIALRLPTVPLDGKVAIAGRAPGAKKVVVLAGLREVAVATMTGESWSAEIRPDVLGLGQALLQARAIRADGTAFRSVFLPVGVEAPAVRKAVATPKSPAVKPPPKSPGGKKAPAPAAAPAAPPSAADGLECTLVGAKGKSVRAPFALSSLGGSGAAQPRAEIEAAAKTATDPWTEARVEGEFEAGPEERLYQFDVSANGTIEIDVDGKPLLPSTACTPDRMRFALAHLEGGWHTIAIRYRPTGAPDLTVLLAGDRVAAPMKDKALRHGAAK